MYDSTRIVEKILRNENASHLCYIFVIMIPVTNIYLLFILRNKLLYNVNGRVAVKAVLNAPESIA